MKVRTLFRALFRALFVTSLLVGIVSLSFSDVNIYNLDKEIDTSYVQVSSALTTVGAGDTISVLKAETIALQAVVGTLNADSLHFGLMGSLDGTNYFLISADGSTTGSGSVTSTGNYNLITSTGAAARYYYPIIVDHPGQSGAGAISVIFKMKVGGKYK